MNHFLNFTFHLKENSLTNNLNDSILCLMERKDGQITSAYSQSGFYIQCGNIGRNESPFFS